MSDVNQVEDLTFQYLVQFRELATSYARRVVAVYSGNVAAVAADDDEDVAARGRIWEIAHGMEPRDWFRLNPRMNLEGDQE